MLSIDPLAEKALGPDGRGELGPEDLHGHQASVLRVVGEIDRRHPAPAELALDGIAGGEGRGDAVEEGGHAASARPGRPADGFPVTLDGGTSQGPWSDHWGPPDQALRIGRWPV